MGTRGTLMVPVLARLRDVSACGLDPQLQPSVGAKLDLLKKRRLRACVRLKGRRCLEAVVPCACVRE